MKKNWFLKYTLWSVIVGMTIFQTPESRADTGMDFLKIDVDARAAAMGGAYTALSSGATATFWNPAGLNHTDSRSLHLMHNSWIADIRQEFLAVQFMRGRHNLAFSVNTFIIPGIEIRGEVPTVEPSGTVEALNFAAALSYATIIKEDWQVGINLKYLYEKYYMELAPGWAADLGLKKTDIWRGMDWGLTMQNLGKMAVLKNRQTNLPMLIRTGLAYELPWTVTGQSPIMATDIQYVKDDKVSVRLGGELRLLQYIALRSGLILNDETTYWTGGFGLRFRDYVLHYAYQNFEWDLGSTHRISLGFQF
ncbi:MAG: PorV/PorQ family protein [Caldithrix sp.]|nr:PorV/PorQ family protein [Caldithrix sp.]